MSSFDLGLMDGAFITLGVQSLIYAVVGWFRRDHDSKPEPTK